MRLVREGGAICTQGFHFIFLVDTAGQFSLSQLFPIGNNNISRQKTCLKKGEDGTILPFSAGNKHLLPFYMSWFF